MKSIFETRSCSIEFLSKLGYVVSPSLPLLDPDTRVQREKRDIARRLFCLHAAVALSFDWNARKTLVTEWLQRENLWDALTNVETEFIVNESKNAPQMRWALEALFCLAWACGLVEVSLLDGVPNNFVFIFPSISKGESTAGFEKKIALKEPSQLVDGLDILYCLDSAITDKRLHGELENNSWLSPMVIRQRRHALEWLMSEEDWLNVPMDT